MPDGKLLARRIYVRPFHLAWRARTSVTIPANTLLFRSEGLRVGVVRDGKAELVPITIGRDYGDKVEVLSGLGPHGSGDRQSVRFADQRHRGSRRQRAAKCRSLTPGSTKAVSPR